MKRISHFIVLFCIVCHSLQAQSLDSPIYTKDKKIPAYYAVPDDADIIKREVHRGDRNAVYKRNQRPRDGIGIIANIQQKVIGGTLPDYRVFARPRV